MTWSIDRSRTEVAFSARHMLLTTVRGRFTEFDAEVELEPHQLERAKVHASIVVASVTTSDAARDAHLRSAEFFDAVKFPRIEFRSTQVTRRGRDVELEGQLEIKAQEHPVKLTGKVVGPSTDRAGTVRVGFSLSGELEREQWGLGWNQALEAGGVLVGKKIKLMVEVQLVQSA
jgi:polyisoprenoid-binding protein YceI